MYKTQINILPFLGLAQSGPNNPAKDLCFLAGLNLYVIAEDMK